MRRSVPRALLAGLVISAAAIATAARAQDAKPSGSKGTDLEALLPADAHRLSESRHFRGKLVFQVR